MSEPEICPYVEKGDLTIPPGCELRADGGCILIVGKKYTNCSVYAKKYLYETFDSIHGGVFDSFNIDELVRCSSWNGLLGLIYDAIRGAVAESFPDSTDVLNNIGGPTVCPLYWNQKKGCKSQIDGNSVWEKCKCRSECMPTNTYRGCPIFSKWYWELRAKKGAVE